MGLRLTDGIALRRIEQETGRPVDQWLDGRRLDTLIDAGLLAEPGARLTATKDGRERLNAVLGFLMADGSRRDVGATPMSQARPA